MQDFFTQLMDQKKKPLTPGQLAGLPGTPDEDFSQYQSLSIAGEEAKFQSQQPVDILKSVEEATGTGSNMSTEESATQIRDYEAEADKNMSVESDVIEQKKSQAAEISASKKSAVKSLSKGKEKGKEDKEGPGFMDKYGDKMASGLQKLSDDLAGANAGMQDQFNKTKSSQMKTLGKIGETAMEAGKMRQKAAAGMQAGFLHALKRGRS